MVDIHCDSGMNHLHNDMVFFLDIHCMSGWSLQYDGDRAGIHDINAAEQALEDIDEHNDALFHFDGNRNADTLSSTRYDTC